MVVTTVVVSVVLEVVGSVVEYSRKDKIMLRLIRKALLSIRFVTECAFVVNR